MCGLHLLIFVFVFKGHSSVPMVLRMAAVAVWIVAPEMGEDIEEEVVVAAVDLDTVMVDQAAEAVLETRAHKDSAYTKLTGKAFPSDHSRKISMYHIQMLTEGHHLRLKSIVKVCKSQ